MYDWDKTESIVLINPRMKDDDKRKVKDLLAPFMSIPETFWVSSSGTLSLKWVALSKAAVLASAIAVNQHLNASRSDIWALVLPGFHVGGLGIWARAYNSGSKVYSINSPKWDVHEFCRMLEESKATLTSLVPAHIYDLVLFKKRAPKSLRGVVVGGGALSDSLYEEGVKLGWPLLPSFGMTECASQIATASLDQALSLKMPPLKILSHMNIKSGVDGFLSFSSPSLLSGFVIEEKGKGLWIDPKTKDGWLISDDRGGVEGCYMDIQGRDRHFIKIGGESVHITRLEMLWQKEALRAEISFDTALSHRKNERLGAEINLLTVKQDSALDEALLAYNHVVMPYERIRSVQLVSEIPRTSLGKFKIEVKEE